MSTPTHAGSDRLVFVNLPVADAAASREFWRDWASASTTASATNRPPASSCPRRHT